MNMSSDFPKAPRRECVRLRIHGRHSVYTPYLFSNLYGQPLRENSETAGSSSDSGPACSLNDLLDDGFYEFPTTEKLMFHNSAVFDTMKTILENLSQAPVCSDTEQPNGEVEYYTDGELLSTAEQGIVIRYGEDSPVCVELKADGLVVINCDNIGDSCMIFESGKRHMIGMPKVTVLSDLADDSDRTQAQMCVSTDEIHNSVTDGGGTLHIAYTVEINGSKAERTDFTMVVQPI